MPNSETINNEPCPVARCVDVVGDRWSLLIVRDAFHGVCRFGDFQRSLGVARNILSDCLRKLVNAGILEMRDASDGTAYKEYVLTSEREKLFPVMTVAEDAGPAGVLTRRRAETLLPGSPSHDQRCR